MSMDQQATQQIITIIAAISSSISNLSNSVKTQNKGYYGIQGHSRSSRSVPIESLYAISY